MGGFCLCFKILCIQRVFICWFLIILHQSIDPRFHVSCLRYRIGKYDANPCFNSSIYISLHWLGKIRIRPLPCSCLKRLSQCDYVFSSKWSICYHTNCVDFQIIFYKIITYCRECILFAIQSCMNFLKYWIHYTSNIICYTHNTILYEKIQFHSTTYSCFKRTFHRFLDFTTKY